MKQILALMALISALCFATTNKSEADVLNPPGEQARTGAIESFFDGSYDEALKILEPMAQQGDAICQYVLAYAFENGFGKEKDLKEAVRWYGKAADSGHLKAMVRLGEMYAVGYGVVSQSDELAVEYMKRAARHGYPEALHFLGMFATWGVFGVSRDTEKAITVFGLAADQGFEPSISMKAALEISEDQKAALLDEMEKARDEQKERHSETLESQQACVERLKSRSFQAASMYFALIVSEDRSDYFFAALLGGGAEHSSLGESYWECNGGVLRVWY